MNAGLFADLFKGGLFAPNPPPPDSIPLRILGLAAMPADRAPVVAAFRRMMMMAHPDVSVDEASRATDATVQELVWARQILFARLPEPVTPTELPPQEGFTRNGARAPRAPVEAVTDTRQGRRRARREAAAARARATRAEARASQRCERCDASIEADRGDARYCSNACRQAAYRQRKSRP
jgi:hypothetical protein